MSTKNVNTDITGYTRKTASGKEVAVKKYSRIQKKTIDTETGKQKGVSPHVKGITPVKKDTTATDSPIPAQKAIPGHLDHLRGQFPKQVAVAEKIKASLETKIKNQSKNLK